MRFKSLRRFTALNMNDPNWGGGGGGQPPRRPDGDGPPDLDEIWNGFWQDFNRRFGAGGRGNNNGNNGGGGKRGGGFGFGKGGGAAHAPGVVGAVIGVALLLWLASGFFIVQEGQQAVITQFGRYHRTVDTAGLSWRLPNPIQNSEVVDVLRIRSVDVGGDNIVKATGLRESAMLTEDENIVEVKFAVQYRLNDARAWLFASADPEGAVRQAAESAVREVVGNMKMDDALARERDQIAPRVRDLMQAIMDRYQIGIEIIAINLQQGGVNPPRQVEAAFNDVLKATQERERAKNLAEAYANEVVPRADGDAARLREDAAGYKARVVAQAEGDAHRFDAVLAEYRRAPQLTRERMYLDAMRDVYAGANKIIVDARAGSLMYLPLEQLMKQNSAPAA
ncbi:MAG: FtsH protease activity modulator HflK, partial [Ottowia sp.]|nr:FtsH protease activity modulator HflK [Ottowia sp.]